jgi:hypothetical protein
MLSTTAKHSPTARGKPDVAERIARLETYERWRPPTKIDTEAIIGEEEWDNYWKLWEKVNADLRQCQEVANSLREKIKSSLTKG